MTAPGPSRLSLEAAHVWRKLSGRRARAQKAAKRAFGDVLSRLTAQDIAIDLGANAGEFTSAMAATGARVYAFEPDPYAFGLLERATSGLQNVTLIRAAAGTEDATATLYRAVAFSREPGRQSKSSSLFAEKRNVGPADAVDIEIRDFPAFLTALDRDVALIKIDIEGAEVPLMEALLAAPVAGRIGAIFVETHERGLPDLAQRTLALKTATAGLQRPHVNWDWH